MDDLTIETCVLLVAICIGGGLLGAILFIGIAVSQRISAGCL